MLVTILITQHATWVRTVKKLSCFGNPEIDIVSFGLSEVSSTSFLPT